jgi:DNA mismatch repair protein MutS
VKQDGPSPLQERLATVHPDEMTAREALMLLYELKDLAEKP